jgi:hypothetical protein
VFYEYKWNSFMNINGLVRIFMMSFLFLSGAAYSASPPVFNEVEIPVAHQDVSYSYDLNLLVTDADNDILTFVVSNLPSWLTLSGSVLSGIPASDNGPCNCTLTVSASDNETTVNKNFVFVAYQTVDNPVDNFEPDNTQLEANLVNGDTFDEEHTLDNKDDVDWFASYVWESFPGKYSNSEIEATVNRFQGYGDIVLSIYDGEGTLLAEIDNTSERGGTESFNASSIGGFFGGVYYYSVKPSSNTVFTEAITYSFSDDTASGTATVEIRLTDENSQTLTSVTSGSAQILEDPRFSTVSGEGIVYKPGYVLAQTKGLGNSDFRDEDGIVVINIEGYEELRVDLPDLDPNDLVRLDAVMSDESVADAPYVAFNEVEIAVAREDIPYSYDLTLLVTNPNNAALTFTVDNLPSWLTLDGSVLSGTPVRFDGPCICTLTVSESGNATTIEKRIELVVYQPVDNPIDSYEPDNTQLQASLVLIGRDYTQEHTIDNKDDIDWFVLYVKDATNHQIRAQAERFQGRGDIVLSVYKADGTLLVEHDRTSEYGEEEIVNIQLEKGLYYFSVKASSNTVFTEDIVYDFFIENGVIPVPSVLLIRLIDDNSETLTSITSGSVQILSGTNVYGVGIVAKPGFILAQSRTANNAVAVFNSDGYEELRVDLPEIPQGRIIELDAIMSDRIVVADTTPPTFQTLTDIVKEATGSSTAVTLPTVTATDDGITIQATASNTGPFSVGTTTITWTATDVAGNSATATQDIIIQDTSKPSFATLTDITAFSAVGNATVDFLNATATDLVDGTITATTNFVRGDYAAGTYQITWTATDTAGNSATATQSVVVTNDETKPVFVTSALADITQEATGTLTAVTLPTVTATDDGSTLQATASDTGPFSVGSTTITWTATDIAGNIETNTQKIIVTDTTKPSFSALVDIIAFAGNGEIAVDFSAATATDIVDGTITATTNFVKGNYNAGTYQITWTATDTAGNSASTTQNVIVTNLTDTDGDGIPNDCNQTCIDLGMTADTDDDNDGIEDDNDGFPLIALGNLTDTDGDGIPNDCNQACIDSGMTADTDDDGDGVSDNNDGFPLIAIGNLTDTDGDGIPNDCDQACVASGMTADEDDDNDGIADVNDGFSLVAIGNLTDTDGDGIPNDCDQACIDVGMTADTDDDGDGVADDLDAFPLDATEVLDTDLDGTGNNADTDDDGDLLPDSFENDNGLDPLDKEDALLDKDQDNLSNIDEYNLGTDINNVDTDGDGITDDIDDRPLDFDNAFPGIYRGELYLLPDITDDGVQEVGVLSVNIELSQIELEVIDGKRKTPLKMLIWIDIYADETLSLHVIDDMNDNGSAEVGLFGIQDTANNANRPQMIVRDLDSDIRVSLLNWPANWSEVKAMVLPDMTGDGVAEVAIQGRFKQGSRPQLVVRDGLTSAAVNTYSYPNLFNGPIYNVHSDVDGDGFAEISTFGRISRNNKIQIKIADGLNPANRLKAYNFPDKWDNISWHQLSDSNSDGKPDWGLFGVNREDGRPQLINKEGADPKGALRIFGWSDDMQDAKFFRIPDMNNDGVDEVAAAGRRSNGRYQFMIKDGADRNSVLANHNLNLPLENLSFHVLPDLSGDEKAEIGFLGINSVGEFELVIREGEVANGEWLTHDLGSDWSVGISIESLGDTDGDGAPNLVIYGQNAVADKLVIYGL